MAHAVICNDNDGGHDDSSAGLGFTSTAYYQRLSRLLDDPDAAVLAPTVVNRLRRIRDQRRR